MDESTDISVLKQLVLVAHSVLLTGDVATSSVIYVNEHLKQL